VFTIKNVLPKLHIRIFVSYFYAPPLNSKKLRGSKDAHSGIDGQSGFARIDMDEKKDVNKADRLWMLGMTRDLESRKRNANIYGCLRYSTPSAIPEGRGDPRGINLQIT